MNRQQNIDEARSLVADIEIGEEGLEPKRWRLAELAAEAVADGMSRRQYAEEVGKSDSTIGEWVKVWERWGARRAERPRFADAQATVRDGGGDIVTRAEETRRQKERQVPTRHEDRVEMAATLLADPKVAAKAVEQALAKPSKTSRLIENAVAEKDAERRRKQAEATRQQRDDGALPLPAYMSAMVVKMNEWEVGLRALEGDLDDLPEGRGRELVGETAERLGNTCYRWAERLKRPALVVIEGGRKSG